MGADTGEFQTMAENLEGGQLARRLFYIEIRGKIKIVNPAAQVTAHMIMNMGRAVKTLLGAANIQFLNNAAPGHDLKIAVDCAQADFWQPLAHHLVEYVGSGMRGQAAQLVENDLALPGYSETVTVEWRHVISPEVDNDYYYRKIMASASNFRHTGAGRDPLSVSVKNLSPTAFAGEMIICDRLA